MQTSTAFTEGNPITTFTFSLEITCFSLYMIETTAGSNGSSTVMHGPFIPAINGEAGSAITLSVSIDSNLTVNEVHNASVIAVGVTGSPPSTGIILFSKPIYHNNVTTEECPSCQSGEILSITLWASEFCNTISFHTTFHIL